MKERRKMQTYKNQYFVSKKMVHDYVYKILFRDKFRLGICVAILSALLIYISFQKKDTFSIGMYGTCMFIVLFVLLVGPAMMVKRYFAYHHQIHNGENVQTIITFQDNILIDEGTTHMEISYSQIKKCYFMQDLWVLMIQKNSGIMIDPKGFDQVSKEEFRQFIMGCLKK